MAGVCEKRDQMFAGATVNTTEGRAVREDEEEDGEEGRGEVTEEEDVMT